MICFSSVSLSPPQKPLFVIGRLGREKKERAWGRREGEGDIAHPIVPDTLYSCYLLIIAVSIRIPSGASAEKRGFVSLPFKQYQIAFFGTKSSDPA